MFGISSFAAAPFASLAGPGILSAEVSEGSTASDSIENIAEFYANIQELAQGLDSPTRRLLWELINTSESIAWATINTSDGTTWSTINTSSASGWQVIKTQP